MLFKNLIANYFGTFILGVIQITSLALYAKVYGLANWGAIATCLALSQLLGFVEFGISNLYTSEFQKVGHGHKIFRIYQFTLIKRSVYAAIITFITVLLISAVSSSEPRIYYNIYYLIATLILAQFTLINNFYYTNLIANNKQIRQNIQAIGFTLLRVTSAYVIGKYVQNVPIAFLICYVIGFLLEILLNEFLFFKEGMTLKRTYDYNLKSANSHILTIGVAIGIIGFYCDRNLLPYMMTATEFGSYSIVITLGLYCLQFQYPIIKSFYPYFARKFHLQENNSIYREIGVIIFCLGILTGIPLSIIHFNATYILELYSIENSLLKQSKLLLEVILISVFLNSVYNVFYLMAVMRLEYKSIFIVNCCVFSAVLAILLLIGREDAFYAGTLSWLIMSMVQLAGAIVFRIGIDLRERISSKV